MGVYPIALSGESFANEDGSSRQAELAQCRVGEPVSLIREADNPHDPNAVRVISFRGITIGYIARDHAEWIAGRIDREQLPRAIIARVNRSAAGMLGAVLALSTDQDDPRTLFNDPLWQDQRQPPARDPHAAHNAAPWLSRQTMAALALGAIILTGLAGMEWMSRPSAADTSAAEAAATEAVSGAEAAADAAIAAADAARATPLPAISADPQLRVDRFAWERTGRYCKASGRLTNMTDTPLASIRVNLDFLDGDRLIASDWTFIDASDQLLPGQASSWSHLYRCPQGARRVEITAYADGNALIVSNDRH